MTTSNKRKIINDPVYGFITIPSEEIYELIQSPYIQRLRRIKQLGLSNLVYPGAEHTRFSHSIGAMYLMTQALDVLRSKGEQITDEEYSVTLQAILLHDCGHAPFSHCLEGYFFDVCHEDLSVQFMKDLGVNSTVTDIFTDRYKKRFLHALVSSQVDTDRLDYLTRDSFFTGVSEGVIGTDRILKMFSVHNDDLVIDEKGVYSIEKFIISRRLMYWQVYMHKTVVAGDCLLRNILKRAKYLAENNALQETEYPISRHLLFFLKNGVRPITDQEALQHYLLLDDTDIWSCVKIWSTHKDKVLSFLSAKLVNREVGKMEVVTTDYTPEDLEERHKALCKKYEGMFSTQDVLDYFCSNGEMHNRAYSFNDSQINILYKNGQIKEIYEASDQLDKNFLSKEIKKYYYFQI